MLRIQTGRSAPRCRAGGAALLRGLAALALCGGGALITGLAPTATPAGASNPSPLLYEIDGGTNAINVFPTTASGNVAPAVTVTANTGHPLNDPEGAVFDAKGDLWVANDSGNNIFEYTPSQLAASGSPSPAVVISDAARPSALTFDADGDLWATNLAGGVEEFTAGQLTSSGNPTPAVTLAGAANDSSGLTFDAAGDLWVGNFSNAVLEYTPNQLTSSGSPTPAVTLSGLSTPGFPTFDAKGDLWFSENANSTVAEFAPNQLTASGSPTPAVSLTGPDIFAPAGLAFDTAGDLWFVDAITLGVYEFTPGQLTSSGSPTPVDTIAGSNTRFGGPSDVLIAQPPVVASISPAAGSGATTVTIDGAGFDYGSTVDFGTTPASSVTYVTPYELRAVAPPGSGTVDVTVSTFAGTSVTTAADQFTYHRGYWLVGSDGGVFSFGAALFHGSMGGIALQRPVVGIVATNGGGGYWLDASDGGVFSFGDAASRFYGSLPGLGLHPAGSGLPHSLNAPVVGMVPSSDDGGYFMVASDGGVFAFGDAHFAGSCPGLVGGCSGAAVAVIPDHSGNGYWLVTKTGYVYAFGDAPYLGAPGYGTVVSAVPNTEGNGYWILLSNGEVFGYGSSADLGTPSPSNFNLFNPAAAIFATADGAGYWISSALGAVYSYGDAPYEGGMSGTPLNGSIIAGTGF